MGCERWGGDLARPSLPAGIGWWNQDLAGDGVVPSRESGGSAMISALASRHLIRSWAGTYFVSLPHLPSPLCSMLPLPRYSQFTFTHFVCASNCLPLPLMLHFPITLLSPPLFLSVPFRSTLLYILRSPPLTLNHLLTGFLTTLKANFRDLSVTHSFTWKRGQRQSLLPWLSF